MPDLLAMYGIGFLCFNVFLIVLLFTKRGKSSFSKHLKREREKSLFTRKMIRILSIDLTRIIFIMSVSITWPFALVYYFVIGFFTDLEKE